MRLYETTFIINPQTDDATIDRQVQDVVSVITNGGGKIIKENRMGTRRLAYLIQGLSQGYYANLVFEAPPTVISEIERHFRLNEAYLRFLTVIFEGSLQDDTVEEESSNDDAAPRIQERPAPSGDGPHGRREDKPVEVADQAEESTEEAEEPAVNAPEEDKQGEETKETGAAPAASESYDEDEEL
ncbi:MAG TPA: 30S ribosomal protein S6 [candidate division Zixibacteria bacterium]|nr:30S ribosomal protein S6 [candidate division Zixibacteria bacterium]